MCSWIQKTCSSRILIGEKVVVSFFVIVQKTQANDFWWVKLSLENDVCSVQESETLFSSVFSSFFYSERDERKRNSMLIHIWCKIFSFQVGCEMWKQIFLPKIKLSYNVFSSKKSLSFAVSPVMEIQQNGDSFL